MIKSGKGCSKKKQDCMGTQALEPELQLGTVYQYLSICLSVYLLSIYLSIYESEDTYGMNATVVHRRSSPCLISLCLLATTQAVTTECHCCWQSNLGGNWLSSHGNEEVMPRMAKPWLCMSHAEEAGGASGERTTCETGQRHECEHEQLWQASQGVQ